MSQDYADAVVAAQEHPGSVRFAKFLRHIAKDARIAALNQTLDALIGRRPLRVTVEHDGGDEHRSNVIAETLADVTRERLARRPWDHAAP